MGKSKAKVKVKVTAKRLMSLADHGPPERANHGPLVTYEAENFVYGKKVKLPTRLHWYEDRALINERMLDAGIRFRNDWEIAASPPRVTGSYGQAIAGHTEYSENRIAARRHFMAAYNALAASYRGICVKVACDDEWASGDLPKLREALDCLADHYGMPRQ